MSSELEKLVAELRAVAAEVEKLRPRLVRHAGLVRDFAAEIAADPEEGRSMGHAQAASLLHQASRQCDALAAELGRAKVAADHFAGRVLSGGGPAAADRAGPSARPAPVPDAKPAGERGHGPATGPLPTLPPEQPTDSTRPRQSPTAGGESPAVAAPAPTDAGKPPLPPFVPWWIPNGAPWHGHRGIAPRRAPDGSPLTEFSPGDLTKPATAGTQRRGGHGGDDGDLPPSRVPIADPSRDLVSAFVEAGYTSPDCLPPGLVEERSFWLDQCGHAALRHAEVRDSALMQRAVFGWDPITGTTDDWEKKGSTHKYAKDATSFRTRADLIFAEAQIWDSEVGRAARSRAHNNERFTVLMPAEQIFGPQLSRHLSGWSRVGSKQNPIGVTPIEFSRHTMIFAVYQRNPPSDHWFAYTIFPEKA